MSPRVTVINPHGFCFGVSRAIKLAQETVAKNPNTYILGEIVHNQYVVGNLEKLGLKTVNSLDEIPEKSTVIIRAHGAAPEIYQQARNKNLNIIDATCPIVAKVHRLVKKLASEKKTILYLVSDPNHDEAIGVISEAPKSIIPVTLKDLKNLNLSHPEKTVVVTQTTLSVYETETAFENLKQKYPSIIIHPHICQATSERQKAVLNSAKDSDLIIIVGSKSSSNSQRLVETATSAGCLSYIIETVTDLNPQWLINKTKISLSSGASTPENLLNDVVNKVSNFNL